MADVISKEDMTRIAERGPFCPPPPDEVSAEILAMTPEQALEQARSDGDDTSAFAERMDKWVRTVYDNQDGSQWIEYAPAMLRGAS